MRVGEGAVVNGIGGGLAIQGAVGEESFAGGLLKQKGRGAAKEVVSLVALFEGDEEDLALPFAPLSEEIGGGEEDVRSVGKRGAEEH